MRETWVVTSLPSPQSTTEQSIAVSDEPRGRQRRQRSFTKGHGTRNDFVLLLDAEGTDDIDAAQVRHLADRRGGVGADGVIRVVPTRFAHEPAVAALADEAPWFMDYRNADGSLSEMCGNGTRVFAAYLVRERLVETDSFAIATRAGVKTVRVVSGGFATGMGKYRLTYPENLADQGFDTLVRVGDLAPLPGLSVDMGNPHVVVMLPPEVDLDDLDLSVRPHLNPEPDQGANIEFVHMVGEGHLRMRVFERGVGETESCGTGVCASAVAAMVWSPDAAAHRSWRVDVLGGTLMVAIGADDHVELSGPAVLVADGIVQLP